MDVAACFIQPKKMNYGYKLDVVLQDVCNISIAISNAFQQDVANLEIKLIVGDPVSQHLR